MSADLLPCPFCGGEARRVDFTATDGEPNAGGSLIECTKCFACSAVHFDRKENLHDSWNRRTQTDAEERGRLKGIEQAASLMDRLSRGSVEGGFLDRVVGTVLRSAGGQLATYIRALAGKTEEKPTP